MNQYIYLRPIIAIHPPTDRLRSITYVARFAHPNQTAAAELRNHSLSVLDVSWAPNIGRSFHMIATSGKDKTLRLYKMKREKQSSDDNDDNTEVRNVRSRSRLQGRI